MRITAADLFGACAMPGPSTKTAVVIENRPLPKIRLRPPVASDAPAMAAAMNNWEIVRWLSANVPYPATAGICHDFIKRIGDAWEEGYGAVFAVLALNDGEEQFAGTIGLTATAADEAVLGFWLGRSFWGQGYGRAMMRGMLTFAFEQSPIETVLAGTDPANTRSSRLLEASGFEAIGVRPFTVAPRDGRGAGPHWRMTKAQWQALEAGRDE